MTDKKRKAAVSKTQREDWLKRNEKGESPPRIAQAEGYDGRTVRKYLDIARQEREAMEARQKLLRDRLDDHFDDLCRAAGKLERRYRFNDPTTLAESSVSYQEELEDALRQHLPRSPIWSLLKRQDDLYQARTELTRALDSKIETDGAANPVLKSKLTQAESGVLPGLAIMLKSLANQWAQGLPGLGPEDKIASRAVGDGLVELNLGPYSVVPVREEHISLVEKAVIDWLERVKEMDEYRQLEKTWAGLLQTEKKLHKEIASIVLKRIVPGRCDYCPI